jgi:PIN domain nuclease of toxin-antitoxin system
MKVNMHEAKSQLSRLGELAWKGERIIIAKAASGWEIAIKRELGTLDAPSNLDAMVESAGFTHLPVRFSHGESAGSLPPHHRDPFDRALVAQARIEGLTVATADAFIPRYDVEKMTAN